MREVLINIEHSYKEKMKILKDQNIFNHHSYINAINKDTPLSVRMAYSIAVLDGYCKLLKYFIAKKEKRDFVYSEELENYYKKEEGIFYRIPHLDLYKQKTEHEFVILIYDEILKLENSLKVEL